MPIVPNYFNIIAMKRVPETGGDHEWKLIYTSTVSLEKGIQKSLKFLV